MNITKKSMSIIPNPPRNFSWEELMKMALEEARRALSYEEVPVGALVITSEGEILAKAHNRTRKDLDPTAHAEIVALRQAAQKIQNYRFSKTYLVVTLEPCIMCLGALHEARIEGIIFGAYDKSVGAVCSSIEGLELANVSQKTWFMGGVLEDECVEILQTFFSQKRN